MKKSFLFFLLPITLFAQENSFDLEENVRGIISTSEGVYLVLEQGLMQINETSPYTKYYRAIYKDSTIINPNTELKEDFHLNIIPFLSPSINEHRIDFNEPLQLGLFIQLNGSNGFNLSPYTKELIDSFNSSINPN